ncbi:hypothetical protein KBC77_03495 [Candidatus Saccharibacteria bacterium]|nr:hypothetical protein [Candidatus Saccharibacteria bacterium]
MICHSKTANGSNCRANAMSTSKYCFTHNSATREQHHAATRKGGQASPYTSDTTAEPIYNPQCRGDAIDTISRIRTVKKDGFMAIANGKMLLGMAFVLSKHYLGDLSQKATRGVRRGFAEGKSSGTPKAGYIRNEDGFTG